MILTLSKALKIAVRWVELEDYEQSTGEHFNRSQFERVFNVHRKTAKRYADIYREGGKQAVKSTIASANRAVHTRMEKARLGRSDGNRTLDQAWRKDFQAQNQFNEFMKTWSIASNYND